MARVTGPKFGVSYRIAGPYVQGIYYIDGKRTYRDLCKLVDVERDPKGRRRSAKQLDAVVRSIWEEKLAELIDGMPAAPELVPISKVFDAWIVEAKRIKASPISVRIQQQTKAHYLDIVGDHPIAEPAGEPPRMRYDLEHGDAYRDGLADHGFAPRTVNTYLGRLSSMFAYACERDILERHPKIKQIRVKKLKARTATKEQIRTLEAELRRRIGAARPSIRKYYYELHLLLFYLMLGTGMRRMEAWALSRADVSLSERKITLMETKTGDPRMLRIPVFLRDALAAHFSMYPRQTLVFEHLTRKGEPAWKRESYMTTAFVRLMRKCGLTGAFKALHGYRSTFNTAGINDTGVNIAAMQRQLGHADFDTTERYYLGDMDDAQLRMIDEMEKVYFAGLFDTKLIQDVDENPAQAGGGKPPTLN